MNWYKFRLLFMVLFCQPVWAAEFLHDGLGPTTTGRVAIRLIISHEISAGIVLTNLDSLKVQDSVHKSLVSSQMVDGLQKQANATIPFCVKSSGGEYFEVTSYEIPGAAENTVSSRTGDIYPVSISFGEDAQNSVKFRAVENVCSENDSIPVNIEMANQLGNETVGRLYGKFNLLVKTE